MRLLITICLFAVLLCMAGDAETIPRTVHVFVALCDNASQGIVKVPARIGNGDDPKSNLYWGASEGFKAYFSTQKDWTLIDSSKIHVLPRLRLSSPFSEPSTNPVLERCLYRHVSGTWLVADAYRGSAIETALKDFLAAAAGESKEMLAVETDKGECVLPLGGGAALVVYLGHNGLMDFDIPMPLTASATSSSIASRQAIVLCCKSEQYFRERLSAVGANPILLITQLMYPGSFLLKNALDGWIKNETRSQIRDRAGQAYAVNQKIGLKAAMGVFSKLE